MDQQKGESPWGARKGTKTQKVKTGTRALLRCFQVECDLSPPSNSYQT